MADSSTCFDSLGLSCDDPRFSTPPNQAYFWSGRTQGIGGEAVARKIAETRGGTTLEKIIEDKKIVMPKYDPTDPASEKAWNDASASYARGASGEVHAVIDEDLRPGNVWQKSELNALMENKNVTKLVQIDPATGAEKLIFST